MAADIRIDFLLQQPDNERSPAASLERPSECDLEPANYDWGCKFHAAPRQAFQLHHRVFPYQQVLGATTGAGMRFLFRTLCRHSKQSAEEEMAGH